MNPPSERNRGVAMSLAAGTKAQAVADQFQISVKRVREIADRVDRYDHGATMLQRDPASIEGLALIGKIPHLARMSLQAAGIERIDDLSEMTLVDLLRLPNIGRRVATILIELRADIGRPLPDGALRIVASAKKDGE